MITLKSIGRNLTKITFDNSLSLYFSYETNIAYNDNGKVRITDRKYSNTTAKHKGMIRELEQAPDTVVIDDSQFQSEIAKLC